MTIEKRVDEAFSRIAEGDFEGSLIPASIALDATAEKEYPNLSQNNERYQAFVSDNLAIITGYISGVPMGGGLRLGWKHRTVHPGPDGRCGLEQILYYTVRCGILHSAEIPSALKFMTGPTFSLSQDQKTLILPAFIIYGILAAVVASPTNSACKLARPRIVRRGDGSEEDIGSLWGQRDTLLGRFSN